MKNKCKNILLLIYVSTSISLNKGDRQMKTFTNKAELIELNACEDGFDTFVEAHADKNAKLSECLESNGWDDVWWLISETYDQFSVEQKNDLRRFGCDAALINIEKIKPYCSNDDYHLILNYLKNPKDSAADSAARSAESAAWSAAMSAFEKKLKELFLKWEEINK